MVQFFPSIIVLPNFKSAMAIGLALAALGRLKETASEDEYAREKAKCYKGIRALYERFGMVLDDKDFTLMDLEFMVSGCMKNKIVYAIHYALPPLAKDLVDKINQDHQRIELLLIAA